MLFSKIILLILSLGLFIMVSSAYTDTTNHFSVMSPDGWRTSGIGNQNIGVKFYDSMNAVNEIYIFKNSKGGRSLEDRNKLQTDYDLSLYPDMTVSSKNTGKINGLDSITQEEKLTIQGISFQLKRTIIEGDSYFYEISTLIYPGNYDKIIPVYDTTVNSFVVITTTPTIQPTQVGTTTIQSQIFYDGMDDFGPWHTYTRSGDTCFGSVDTGVVKTGTGSIKIDCYFNNGNGADGGGIFRNVEASSFSGTDGISYWSNVPYSKSGILEVYVWESSNPKIEYYSFVRNLKETGWRYNSISFSNFKLTSSSQPDPNNQLDPEKIFQINFDINDYNSGSAEQRAGSGNYVVYIDEVMPISKPVVQPSKIQETTTIPPPESNDKATVIEIQETTTIPSPESNNKTTVSEKAGLDVFFNILIIVTALLLVTKRKK